jgi:hypothetical protein
MAARVGRGVARERERASAIDVADVVERQVRRRRAGSRSSAPHSGRQPERHGREVGLVWGASVASIVLAVLVLAMSERPLPKRSPCRES